MAGERIGIIEGVLGLAVSLTAGCATLEIETDARLDKTVETLLEAIRARDDGVILSLAANPQAFGENGRLQGDVAGFLYDGDHVRGYNPEARSVVEIMALGPVRAHILREKGGPATVISSPKPPVKMRKLLWSSPAGEPPSFSYLSSSRSSCKLTHSTASVGCATISPVNSI